MTTATEEKKEREEKLTVEQQRIYALFERIQPGDRLWIHRVALKDGGGFTLPVKHVIEDFTGITDLEYEVYRLAREYGWESGEYVLRLRQSGKPGTAAEGRIFVELPVKPGAPNGATSPLEVVRTAKELLTPGPSAVDVARSVTEALRTGAEVARSNQPAAAAGESATLKIVSDVLGKVLDKLGERKPDPAQDPLATLTKFVETLDRLGLVRKPGEDDEGGGPAGGPAGVVDQLSELERIIDIVERFRGGGRVGDPEHWGVAIARVLAPHVPQFLRTIDNVVDTARLRMLQYGGGGPVPTVPAKPAELSAGVQAFVAETNAAIARDDDTYFPQLAQGIATLLGSGGQFLLDLQEGRLDEEPAMGVIQTTGLFDMRQPKPRAYFLRFTHWLRRTKPVQPAPGPAATPPPSPSGPAGALSADILAPGEVVGRCAECGQEYKFSTREEYDTDTRLCDNRVDDGQGGDRLCGGTLECAEPGR